MPMEVVRDDIWVCQDCLMWLCNGDASGMPDDETVARVQAGAAALGNHIVPDFCSEHDPSGDDGECEHCERDDDGIREFSRYGCDCCGSHLAGSRHRFAQLGEVQRYAYGNGEPGCLFDNVSGPYDSIGDAAESAAMLLELTEDERAELEADHIIYFHGDRRHEVGAGLVKIFEVDADWTDGSPD